jgi:hypothetical protein
MNHQHHSACIQRHSLVRGAQRLARKSDASALFDSILHRWLSPAADPRWLMWACQVLLAASGTVVIAVSVEVDPRGCAAECTDRRIDYRSPASGAACRRRRRLFGHTGGHAPSTCRSVHSRVDDRPVMNGHALVRWPRGGHTSVSSGHTRPCGGGRENPCTTPIFGVAGRISADVASNRVRFAANPVAAAAPDAELLYGVRDSVNVRGASVWPEPVAESLSRGLHGLATPRLDPRRQPASLTHRRFCGSTAAPPYHPDREIERTTDQCPPKPACTPRSACSAVISNRSSGVAGRP